MKRKIKELAVRIAAESFGGLFRRQSTCGALTYHYIGYRGTDKYSLSRETFVQHMNLLSDLGFRAIRSAELASGWREILSARAVLITFDDGYKSQLDACEILDRYRMTATFFVNSSRVGTKGYLDWSDLHMIQAHGFEIGSHSHNHVNLAHLTEAIAWREISKSKRTIEQSVGSQIVSFAYPYGRRGAYSDLTKSLLRRAGYSIAFTQNGGMISAKDDILEVPRMGIDSSDSLRILNLKLQGNYDMFRGLRRIP